MGSWCHGVPGEQRSFERKKKFKQKFEMIGQREMRCNKLQRATGFPFRLLMGLHTKAHPVVKSNKTHRAQRTKREGDYKPVVTTHPFPSWQVCVHTCKCPWCVSKWAFNEMFKALLFRLWRGSLSLLFGAHMQTVGETSEIKENNHKQSVYPIKTKKPAEQYFKLLFYFMCAPHVCSATAIWKTPLAHDTLLQPEKSQITEKYNKINPTYPSLTSDCFVKKHLLCLSEITQDSSPASSIANESTSI